MFFYLKISCKDKRILKKFLEIFTKIKSLPIYIKPFSRREKRKFVTVLKSPHVNKTAQEQFEYRIFSRHFLIFSLKPQIFFLFIKKLKNLSFSGVKLEVKGVFEKNIANKYLLKLVNPDNVVLKTLDPTLKNFRKDKKEYRISQPISSESDLLKKYVQSFDSYGETYLKNTFYGK